MAGKNVIENATLNQSMPGVEYDAGTGGDIYLGKPEALIAAELLTSEQIPGWPGMPASSATFIDGNLQHRGRKTKHDEHWMHVTRYGNRIRLTKGITAEEQRRRMNARQAEIEEAERNRPKTDIGIDAARKACQDASALFKEGDSVRIGDHSLVVTGGYELRSVCAEEGEFYDARLRVRTDYRYGYTCQFRNGEEYFFEAHELTDDDGFPTHLRLVRGGAEIVGPMLTFRGQR